MITEHLTMTVDELTKHFHFSNNETTLVFLGSIGLEQGNPYWNDDGSLNSSYLQYIEENYYEREFYGD